MRCLNSDNRSSDDNRGADDNPQGKKKYQRGAKGTLISGGRYNKLPQMKREAV